MESPLFSGHFKDESWKLLYFDALRKAYLKTKEKTDLECLYGLKENTPLMIREELQLSFDIDEERVGEQHA